MRKWSDPSRRKLPFVATTTTTASAIVATKKITRTTVLTAARRPQVSSGPCTSCGRRRRAPSSASRSTRARWSPRTTRSRCSTRSRGRVVIVTDVPGVVRELYVEAGLLGDARHRHRAHRRVLNRASVSSSTAAGARGTRRHTKSATRNGTTPTNHVVQRGWRWKSNHQSSPIDAPRSHPRGSRARATTIRPTAHRWWSPCCRVGLRVGGSGSD